MSLCLRTLCAEAILYELAEMENSSRRNKCCGGGSVADGDLERPVNWGRKFEYRQYFEVGFPELYKMR